MGIELVGELIDFGFVLTLRYKPGTPPTACIPGTLESFFTASAVIAYFILPIILTINRTGI